MNVGDSVGGSITILPGGYADIKPTDGTTWLIQNLSLAGPFQLSIVTIHTSIGVTGTANNTFLNDLCLYCNTNVWWRIYNTDTVSHNYEYNGIIINDGTNGAIAVGGYAPVAGGQVLTIQPPAGQEWEINYILGGSPYSVFWQPSGNVLLNNGQANVWTNGLKLALTNSHYLIVENTGSGTYYLSYAGSRTK